MDKGYGVVYLFDKCQLDKEMTETLLWGLFSGLMLNLTDFIFTPFLSLSLLS